ncbi:MAG: alkaline phosphatase family protein, partial [Rhodoferax sp.]
MRPLSQLTLLTAACLASLLGGCAATGGPTDAKAAHLERIQNVVVIYAENHSFDNMYGLFPGANGISRATAEEKTQIDHDGKPLKELVV